jgi:DNA-directed RNA polymerase specialized sigma24 family protein
MNPDYTPGQIAALLPHAYDANRGWGFQLGDAERPEPGMPIGSHDPSRAGTLWAMTADTQRALKHLPMPTRQDVFLYYVDGWQQDEIAKLEGITQQAVAYRLYGGIRQMATYLNGESWEDNDEGDTYQLLEEAA